MDELAARRLQDVGRSLEELLPREAPRYEPLQLRAQGGMEEGLEGGGGSALASRAASAAGGGNGQGNGFFGDEVEAEGSGVEVPEWMVGLEPNRLKEQPLDSRAAFAVSARTRFLGRFSHWFVAQACAEPRARLRFWNRHAS